MLSFGNSKNVLAEGKWSILLINSEQMEEVGVNFIFSGIYFFGRELAEIQNKNVVSSKICFVSYFAQLNEPE